VTGYTNARIWLFFGVCRASSAFCNELDVVREDPQGIEKDFGEETMR